MIPSLVEFLPRKANLPDHNSKEVNDGPEKVIR